MPEGRLPRVLLVAPHFPPEGLAAAVRLGSLARELAALGHAVVVVTPGEGSASDTDGEAHPGLRVHRVACSERRAGRLGNALHQFALRRALSRGLDACWEGAAAGGEPRAADVVIVSSPPPVAALAGAAFARRHRLPLIVDVRDIWPDVLIEAGALSRWSPAAWLLRAVERRLLASAAAVSVVTPSKRVRLSARTRAPVSVVPNGVDAAWCDGGDAHAGGGEDGDFEVLHAGNLGLAQDVSLLATAVGRLATASRSNPAERRVVATIVGRGEDAGQVAEAARRAGEVVTMRAPESREQVRARLARCGCAFVGLRRAEIVDAVPSKLLEAMGRGVPVVASVAGEAAALVREAEAGLVTPPGDADALAEALRRMASLSPEARRAMGQRGRAFVLSRFRRETAAALMSRMVREICAATGRSGGRASLASLR